VTSHEVAALAGVSRSAVSRTFTPDASVSEKTRQKVLAAAQKLGYRPNVIARSLITRKSRLIGLIMGEWDNPFYTTMLRGFTEKLHGRDYQVMLLGCRSPEDVDAAVSMLMQYRVDGIVFVSTEPRPESAREFVRAGGRLVLVNRDAPDLPVTSIVCDNVQVGRELADMLLAAGYERFALIRGSPTMGPNTIRTLAFQERLQSRGRGRIIVDRVNLFGYSAGRSFAREVLALAAPPDAIVCSSDVTAIGVLDGARMDRGLAIPAALGVVGFGDVPAAAWASHDLTTVRLPIERMIDAAIEALLAERKPDHVRQVFFEASIVPRSTVRLVAPLPAAGQ
jgi:DNA-binding LacI/PurR family transcriptional regulator